LFSPNSVDWMKLLTIHTYLPQDRLRAIANNTTLPDRTSGTTLFADISGFTALTESLRESLGSRQGAEELTRRLGKVYSALIAEIEEYGGSVIGFAGDSMLCWFNAGDGDQGTGVGAVSCAFGMQDIIRQFPELGLKVAITSGDARRFVVGNPEIQRIDALAGATVSLASKAEHHANKGDVVLDEVTANNLAEKIKIMEWREDGDEKFAVIRAQDSGVGGRESESAEPQTPTPESQILKPYVHQAVYERETSGQGSFLTEFRPCVALFVRFTGIDYDSDSAESELDTFIRTVQAMASRYEGTLMDITIGDKGSYAYVNFGALSAHEDDSRRAVKTALELRNKTELQLQMGITQGVMRVGAYGGETRKVFGALGDDVNLAARLMTTAKENEILLSSHVHKAVVDEFTFEPRPPLPMKGKAEPLPVFAVTGESQRRAVRLQEPNYSLPMVGRQPELTMINEKLTMTMEGKSQVIGIVAEAGVGKSRLVAEVIRSARKMGFVGFGGACQSDGIHTPYLAWKSIWQAFFDVDPEMPERRLVRLLEGEIEDRAPSRVDAMPLLNVVLDLNIPENDFTQNLEPKIRQSALHALLEDCLKAQAKDEPTLIVIEDLHWIDALSHDLLEGLAKALANHAVCFVLAYRPPELERLHASSPRIEALEQFTRIELHELTTTEAESAVRAKLTQLYPARGGALPTGLVEALMRRAQGNPFYLEELLNYVRDRGLDPSDIQNIDLPDSLHTLILSRIDQLSEAEKTTLRVASIVGRLFRAQWLTGYYPELGSFPQVKAALDELDKLEITLLDSEPELTYLFKHIVTHEVTYESLPFATRARLHEQLARYLESADAPVETIAFHYARSENKDKQIEYLQKAGEASRKNYANDAALEYYSMLLPLLDDDRKKAQIYLMRGEVYEFMGKWDNAESDYRAAFVSTRDDLALKASVQFALGKLHRQRADYGPALDWLEQAKETRTKLEDTSGLAQVLIEMGYALWRKGENVQARELSNEALLLARKANDKVNAADALTDLGRVATGRGDFIASRALHEESLALRREIGDMEGIGSSLSNLGWVANFLGDFAAARVFLEESLALHSEMGTYRGMGFALCFMGVVTLSQGDYAAAQAVFEKTLELSKGVGDKWGIGVQLGFLGQVALAQGDYNAARRLFEESLALNREVGDKWGIALQTNNLGIETLIQGDYAGARSLYEESLAICKEMDDKSTMAYSLLGLGLVDLAEGKQDAREHILGSLRLRVETGERPAQTSSLIGAAGLALQEGEPQFAAQLLGAVESAIKTLKAAVEPEVKFFHESTLAKVKQALGDAAFRSVWEEGSQWSLEEAVKKVFGDDM